MAQEVSQEATPQPEPVSYGAPQEAVVTSSRPRSSTALGVLSSLAVITALYFAREIVIPVFFAVLLALLLRPIQRRMRRVHVPDFVSALVLVAAVVAVYLFGVITLAGQAHRWLAKAPEMVAKVSRMVPSKSGPIRDLEKATAAVEDLTRSDQSEDRVKVEVKSQDVASTVLGVSSHFVASSIIVFVVGYFLLALSDTLLRQAVQAQSSFLEKRNVVELLQNVEYGISRYLLTITVINTVLGVVTGLAMWLLGVPNPVLWGVMAGTLNYVPHVGAFVCMVILFFVGAVTHESIGYGALVAGTFVALTSIESYFVTPMVLSKSLQLSPLAVILAILFWGWLWGIPGGLMAAPLVAIAKIICDQFQSLRGIAALLGGEAISPPANDVAPPTTAASKQAA